MTTAPTVPTRSRYRCGGHPDVPVSWKGHGCQRCAADLVRFHADHQRKRRARADDLDDAGWSQ